VQHSQAKLESEAMRHGQSVGGGGSFSLGYEGIKIKWF